MVRIEQIDPFNHQGSQEAAPALPEAGAEVIPFPTGKLGNVAINTRLRILNGYKISVRSRAMTPEQAVDSFNMWSPDDPITHRDLLI
jgi:hypothetical protein